MVKSNFIFFVLLILITSVDCKKAKTPSGPSTYSLSFTVNDAYNGTVNYGNVNLHPKIKFSFTDAVDTSDVNNNFSFTDAAGNTISFVHTIQTDKKSISLEPAQSLSPLTRYKVGISPSLLSVNGGKLSNPVTITITTTIDSTDKFPLISDDELLDLVQKQTFKYFWDFGHPVSGMARERNISGDIVTTGGTGFGIMSIITAVNRNFISRTDGLLRIQKIVRFLKNNCIRYHGAFAHWINGATGATIPFSEKDNGADLVETSFLMQGLLCARQYFNSPDITETLLRNDINELWNGVEWNWFRQDEQNVLYWHWSPDYNFDMNLPIKGWNEALITYVLAASSNTDSIPKAVYDEGWAQNGAIQNGNSYFNIQLPLGPPMGGPLFFAHYSFLGINPHDLTDGYANYWTQNVAHSKINYQYCVDNPLHFNGYSDLCWGLTASDDNVTGYAAHEPGTDIGVITPSAAISSIPYTPTESMNALKFFYYKLGDKLWGDYGFKDAFNLTNVWFADSYLAIDQGPQIVMIENYRSGLLWKLFMSCPEIKRGIKALSFSSPNLE
ncbi:MAG: glucoamylase family protein [Ilyomonas sp.]